MPDRPRLAEHRVADAHADLTAAADEWRRGGHTPA
jgi:hypothetical protein